MRQKRRLPVRRQEWGQLGPAMKALPNDRWREFVYQLVVDSGYGSLTRAAVAAGFGKTSTKENLHRHAWILSRDERMIAAIAEESAKIVRVAGPAAANALLNLVNDPTHREHGRAIALVLERTDPATSVSRSHVEVVHKIVDPDTEALEELRALRHLNTPREKLIELFGENGLHRLERLERADDLKRADTAKLIEHDAEMVDG
jgi:hypothetical protein